MAERVDPQPIMQPWELAVVGPHVQALSPRKTYLEIGSNHGGSLIKFCCWMEPGALAVCVDLPGTRQPLLASADRLRDDGYDIRIVAGDSRIRKTRESAAAALEGRQVDVLMIDGAHDLSSVALDAHNYIKHVRQGGLVIFHDCGPALPTEAYKFARRQAGIFAVWRDCACGHKSLLVQHMCGLGLIWM